MRSFPRTLGRVVAGFAVAASLSSCGTVTITHSLRDTTAGVVGVPTSTPSALVTPDQAGAPVPEPALAPPGRAAFGDSVMLGAKAELAHLDVRVDALVGRQFHSGIVLLRRAAASGTLPRNVIVHLGTNGTASVADCRRIVDQVGDTRRVFFVTVHGPRSWMAADNAHLSECAAAYPDHHVVLIPWDDAARRHPGWFYADGIHLNGPGRAAYAAIVTGVVDTLGL